MKQLLGIAGASAALAFSVQFAAAEDIEGASDHPILSRFAGAEIVAYYNEGGYEEIKLPSGPITDEENPENVLELEGRAVFHTYRVPEGISTLEIGRNYENALEDGGFNILFSCKGPDECGEKFARYVRGIPDDVYEIGMGFWGGRVSRTGIDDPSYLMPAKSRAYLAVRNSDSSTDHILLLLEGQNSGLVGVHQIVVEGDPRIAQSTWDRNGPI